VPAGGETLRTQILESTAAGLEFASDEEYPTVYGLVTEYRIGEHTASIVCLRDGTASLYTTSGFGILGGQAYDFVREAAVRCVKLAETHVGGSPSMKKHPLPAKGEVRFYFLTYDGLRMHRAKQADIDDGSSSRVALYAAAQDVLVLLRHITEIQAEREAAK